MKLLAATLSRLLALLPLGAGRRCAAWLAKLLSRLDTDLAAVTRTNLALCFPELDQSALRQLAHQSLAHSCCLLFESGPLAHWRGARLSAWVVSETGRAPLTSSLRQSGVLLLAPHFGNWEFLCFALGDLGFIALYDPPRMRSLDGRLRRSRERFGGRLLPAGRSGLRAAYRQLRGGGLVCLLPDQVPEGPGGVYAPFFRQPTLTATLAHRLIQRAKPAVWLASARRVQGGFSLVYEPLAEGIYAPAAEVSAQALNQAIEALVRRAPAQYQWEYKRFKRQPQGSPSPYPKRRKKRKKTK